MRLKSVPGHPQRGACAELKRAAAVGREEGVRIPQRLSPGYPHVTRYSTVDHRMAFLASHTSSLSFAEKACVTLDYLLPSVP